ncbi:Uncharacterised protein [Yersinia ruckeri]|uniref:Fimbrial protein n=1 Tax=Yersinia ruckeri TaxID=29486 RepID=A0A380SAS6_YERRU|nr:type 1 fimbrial protein [Yersinia ruckeri]SUQ37323.1 Uncharacterised protein [Yersinia ruckeri]
MSNYRLLGLALICFSGMALADNAANTGTVSFTGAIVDTSCQFEVVVQTLETHCYRNGKIFNQRQVITADSASYYCRFGNDIAVTGQYGYLENRMAE